ncbi:MAG TPA: pilus assembly protein N-terminal domain-containing protein [Burkholderiaceae bacterium]|jgi:pilus assembly protein CpaC|nr:pilus assembly protein N-terminal domain-containing protein [Burkholderiaceae bacterium]
MNACWSRAPARAALRHVLPWLIAAALLAASPGLRAAPVVIELYVGQAHVIDEPDVRRIAVGNGKVMQATALDDRQILVLPEAAGQSTLHLWRKDGSQRHYVFNVLAADASRLLAEVQAMIGASRNVTARLVGDKVVIEGSNVTEEEGGRLAEIAKRFPQAVNLVPKIGFERMIAMDVRIIEIRRELLENIGVRWDTRAPGPSFSVVGDFHRSTALQPGGRATGTGLEIRERVRPFATAFGLVTSLSSMLNFLVQNGDAVILAEPRLSCRSGGSARFVAGGELPIPVSGLLGHTSVAFKEYGVKFEVSPVATETGVIAAKIATEISSINFDVSVKEVPGLIKRRAETEVNLRENETLVIAGLLTDEGARNLDKVAGAADLPILGRLFRSRLFRERQTELVVFITPRFVGGEVAAEIEPPPAAADAVGIAVRRHSAARERVRMVE